MILDETVVVLGGMNAVRENDISGIEERRGICERGIVKLADFRTDCDPYVTDILSRQGCCFYTLSSKDKKKSIYTYVSLS